jgi:hypothetical protein
MSITSARRAVAFAALLAIAAALGASSTWGLGGSARADDPVAQITDAPDLNWGFKATWRNYAQDPVASAGAEIVAPSGGALAYDVEWAFDKGSYDPATRTTQVAYRGSVHWQKYRASALGRAKPPGYTGPETDPYLLDVTLADPQITISRDSSVLTAIATSRNQDTWELISYGRVPIVDLDVLGVSPTVAGGSTAWAGIVATVSSQGNAAMAGNYRVGQVADEVSFGYGGPGGAPDFTEHWDQPGTAVLKLVDNELFIDGEEAVTPQPIWVDREHQIVHSSRSVTVAGVPSQEIQAFGMKAMEPLGDPLVLPNGVAPTRANIGAYDGNADRVLYRGSGEVGMPRWLRFNPTDDEYETGVFADPQMGSASFFGAETPFLAWDPTRNRGYRVERTVPEGASGTQYDSHVWKLFTFAEGAGGVWVKKAFNLPSFPSGQNREGYAPSTATVPGTAAASDGSLILLATNRAGLAATEKIPAGYRIVFNEADDGVAVAPLPGIEVLNSIAAGGTFKIVQTSANGHVLLVKNNAAGEVMHLRIAAGGQIESNARVSIRDNVEASPYDEWRYALDPSDGTVWFGGITTQKLAAVRGGAFAGGQFFKERNPKGGPVLVGDDHFVYAQTNDGSPGESGGSKSWGYGKFERLGFVPTVTAQPQPDSVSLGAGEASEAATFGSTASGDPAPARQWQVKAPGSTKFVDLAGQTAATLTVAATRGDDGSEYRAVYANAAGKVASEPAPLAVEYAPLALQSPANATVLEGGDAEFAVLADGKPEPTVTWQRRIGGFWQDVDGADESVVVDGNSLSVLDANPEQSGAMFRARLTNALGAVASQAAKLTVTPKVSIPAEGIDLDHVSLDWTGSGELQKAPPFGGSNYFSAGVSAGDEASYRPHQGDAFVFQVAAGGSEALASWATRAQHVANGGGQLVRLYGGSGRVEPDGSAVVSWDADFSVNFYGGLAPFTLGDPVLTVDADGAGALAVDVVGCASSMANPNQCDPLPPAADVTLATFSRVEVDPAGELVVDPDYAGVEVKVPAGVAPQDRGVPGWGAWPQPFVDYQAKTGLAPYWYSSGGAADPLKGPQPFVVDFAGAEPPVVAPPPANPGATPQPAPPAVVAPSIVAVKRKQTVGVRRAARVAQLRCLGATRCEVSAPRRVAVRIGGRVYWADVFVPATIRPGGTAAVRAKLSRAALEALGDGGAKLRVRLLVRSAEGVARMLAEVGVEAAG